MVSEKVFIFHKALLSINNYNKGRMDYLKTTAGGNIGGGDVGGWL